MGGLQTKEVHESSNVNTLRMLEKNISLKQLG